MHPRAGRPPILGLVALQISSWLPGNFWAGRPPTLGFAWSPATSWDGRPPILGFVALQFSGWSPANSWVCLISRQVLGWSPASSWVGSPPIPGLAAQPCRWAKVRGGAHDKAHCHDLTTRAANANRDVRFHPTPQANSACLSRKCSPKPASPNTDYTDRAAYCGVLRRAAAGCAEVQHSPRRRQIQASQPQSRFSIPPNTSRKISQSESVDGNNPAPPKPHDSTRAFSTQCPPRPPDSMLTRARWCRIASIQNYAP